MRTEKIAPGEHYHVFNRGVGKQIIFHDTQDYYRFLFLILCFQSPVSFPQVGRAVSKFVKSRALDNMKDIVDRRTVELVVFCIMPNHFHLIAKEVAEGGIVIYMQRVLTAYSKYYNTKYGRSGHVFQGPYRFVHIADDRQLLHLSAYIHRNCRELRKWFRKEDQYFWSSYQDFIKENRWGDLISPKIVSGQFKNKEKYKKFVETSPTKLIEGELSYINEPEPKVVKSRALDNFRV